MKKQRNFRKEIDPFLFVLDEHTKKEAIVLPVKTIASFLLNYSLSCFLHHAAHAAHTRSSHRQFRLIFLLLTDNTLCCQEHTGD